MQSIDVLDSQAIDSRSVVPNRYTPARLHSPVTFDMISNECISKHRHSKLYWILVHFAPRCQIGPTFGIETNPPFSKGVLHTNVRFAFLHCL